MQNIIPCWVTARSKSLWNKAWDANERWAPACVSLFKKCCARMQNYSRLGNHLIGFRTCCFGWCSRAAENTQHIAQIEDFYFITYTQAVCSHASAQRETRTRALADANWIGNWKVWPSAMHTKGGGKKSTSHPVNIGVCLWAEFVTEKFTWNIYCIYKMCVVAAHSVDQQQQTWINFKRESGPAQREIKVMEFIF